MGYTVSDGETYYLNNDGTGLIGPNTIIPALSDGSGCCAYLSDGSVAPLQHTGPAAIGFDTVNRACIQGDGSSVYVNTGVKPPTTGFIEVGFIYEHVGNQMFIGASDTNLRCFIGQYANTYKIALGFGTTTWSVAEAQGTTDLIDGQYYVARLEWDGTTVRLLLDGNEEVSIAQPGSATDARDIYIAALNALGSDDFHSQNKIVYANVNGTIFLLTESAGEVIHAYDAVTLLPAGTGQLYADDIDAAWSEVEGSEVANPDWLYGFSRRENLLPVGAEDLTTWTQRGTVVTHNGDGSYRVSLGAISTKDLYLWVVSDFPRTSKIEAKLVSGTSDLVLWNSSGVGENTTQGLSDSQFTPVELVYSESAGGPLLYSSDGSDLTVDLRFPQVSTAPQDAYVTPGTLGRQPGIPGSTTDAAGNARQYPPYFWGNVDHEGACDMKVASCMRAYLADTTAFARGENLVSNGDFAADLTGWIKYGNYDETRSWSSLNSGCCKFEKQAASGFEGILQSGVMTAGGSYLVSIDLYRPAGSNAAFGINAGGVVDNDQTPAQYDEWTTVSFLAEDVTGTDFAVYARSGDIGVLLYVDNVVIRKYSPLNALFGTDKEPLVLEKESRVQDLGEELVVNGDASDTTSTDSSAAPLSDWTNYGTHDATNKVLIVDGTFNLLSDGTNVGLSQAITSSEQEYRYSIKITDVSSGTGVKFVGATDYTESINSVGVHTGTFIADSSAVVLQRVGGVTDISFTNISVREIEATTNNAGDQALITKCGQTVLVYPEPTTNSRAEKIASYNASGCAAALVAAAATVVTNLSVLGLGLAENSQYLPLFY